MEHGARTSRRAVPCVLLFLTCPSPVREPVVQSMLSAPILSITLLCTSSKVVVPPSTSGGESVGASGSQGREHCGGEPDDDPAAEWLYLLFCCFVHEGLCRSVYDNVGIRAGKRRKLPRRQGGCGAVTVGSARVAQSSGEEHGAAGGSGSVPTMSGVGDGREGGEERDNEEEEEDGDEDFFFPVTPEQLIVLNLAELVTGKCGWSGRTTLVEETGPDSLLWFGGRACGALGRA